MPKFDGMPTEELLAYIKLFRDDNIFAIAELLRRGVCVEKLHEVTQITAYFLEAIANIVAMEKRLAENVGSEEVLRQAKKMGFGDKFIAKLWDRKEIDVYHFRKERGIVPVFKMVDTCHTGAYIPYFYSSYSGENASVLTEKKSASAGRSSISG
jgi:carbamoyl-phosphate synthase large subunit